MVRMRSGGAFVIDSGAVSIAVLPDNTMPLSNFFMGRVFLLLNRMPGILLGVCPDRTAAVSFLWDIP
jgi:hypothetical protein